MRIPSNLMRPWQWQKWLGAVLTHIFDKALMTFFSARLIHMLFSFAFLSTSFLVIDNKVPSQNLQFPLLTSRWLFSLTLLHCHKVQMTACKRSLSCFHTYLCNNHDNLFHNSSSISLAALGIVFLVWSSQFLHSF